GQNHHPFHRSLLLRKFPSARIIASRLRPLQRAPPVRRGAPVRLSNNFLHTFFSQPDYSFVGGSVTVMSPLTIFLALSTLGCDFLLVACSSRCMARSAVSAASGHCGRQKGTRKAP